jgi:putative ATPase
MDRGKGYIYPHDHAQGGGQQEYLPKQEKEREMYYQPKECGYEAVLKKRLEAVKKDKSGS